MKPILSLFTLWLCVFGFAAAALAQTGNEFYEFETAAQERQFNQLTRELRCPKCQNQSIADSDAPLAMDMRQRVYQMVMEGDSREEIIDFMKVRYGDFVHYNPPIKPSTIILWLAPLLVIVLGVITIVFNLRGQSRAVAELSAEEQARLDALLHAEDQLRAEDQQEPHDTQVQRSEQSRNEEQKD